MIHRDIEKALNLLGVQVLVRMRFARRLPTGWPQFGLMGTAAGPCGLAGRSRKNGSTAVMARRARPRNASIMMNISIR